MKDRAPLPVKILTILIIAALLVVLLFAAGFTRMFNRVPDSPAATKIFEVREGANVTRIAEELKAQEIISRKWVFLWGYRLFFSSHSLKAGEYALSVPLSPKEVLNLLIAGRTHLHSFTVAEGLTRRETAEELENAGFVNPAVFLEVSADPSPIAAWDPDARDLEGYLFPETYSFPKGTTEATIVTAMTEQFKTVFQARWKARAEELGMSVREIVTLASLIEKETSKPEERALVSSVFHNRLRIKMKLDCDPTIVYALKQIGEYTGRLRYKDLKHDSPYNTYLYGGLPPGPIANPGRASLEAALYPADSEFFYFVSRNDGSHHFSRTYREHVNAVNKYQRNR
jgi:UPF0755 protein